MTSKGFSFAAFVEYGNRQFNTKESQFSEAVRKDIKKSVSGIMTAEEISMIDNVDIDMSNTLALVPELVSSFMNDEDRAFTLPAPNPSTCSATIKMVDKDRETKTGTIQFGENAGKEYKTTIEAHTEFSVKNNRDNFKK